MRKPSSASSLSAKLSTTCCFFFSSFESSVSSASSASSFSLSSVLDLDLVLNLDLELGIVFESDVGADLAALSSLGGEGDFDGAVGPGIGAAAVLLSTKLFVLMVAGSLL